MSLSPGASLWIVSASGNVIATANVCVIESESEIGSVGEIVTATTTANVIAIVIETERGIAIENERGIGTGTGTAIATGKGIGTQEECVDTRALHIVSVIFGLLT